MTSRPTPRQLCLYCFRRRFGTEPKGKIRQGYCEEPKCDTVGLVFPTLIDPPSIS